MEEKIAQWKKRDFSWSQLSSWEYNPDQWFRKYILNDAPDDNRAMSFGKVFAKSLEDGTCTIKELVDKLPYKKEYPFKVKFGGTILVGFADDFDDKTFTVLNEVKTGKKPWDQKRVDEHGQITMYCLLNYVTNKVRPEDVKCALHWIKTEESSDFAVRFVEPVIVHTFTTKRTMQDILAFGVRIKKARKEMEKWAKDHLVSSL